MESQCFVPIFALFRVVLCLGFSFLGLGFGDVLFRISSGIVG